MWEWLAFTAIMAVGQFSPGPDMILLTRTALAQGRAAGCWTALGITTGLGVHALIAVTGVVSLLAHGGWLEILMRCLGSAYLLWLAFQLLRSAFLGGEVKIARMESDEVPGRLSSWKQGLLCNLLNPKVAIFLAGVTAPFLLNQEGWKWPLLLWLTITVEGALLWCLWASLLQHRTIKSGYLRVARWFDLAFGLGLLAIAVVLVRGIF